MFLSEGHQVDRPERTRNRCKEEHVAALGVHEKVELDRDNWRMAVGHYTSL